MIVANDRSCCLCVDLVTLMDNFAVDRMGKNERNVRTGRNCDVVLLPWRTRRRLCWRACACRRLRLLLRERGDCCWSNDQENEPCLYLGKKPGTDLRVTAKHRPSSIRQ